MSIKSDIFDRAVKKEAKKNPRKQRFVTYEKAKSILLIYESNEKTDHAVNKIAQQLKKDGKEITIWGFVNAKKILEAPPEVKVFCRKDTNLFEKPNKKIINEALATKFDLLIDLSLHTYLPLSYLVLYSNATMKTGSKISKNNIYDFILDFKQSPDNKKTGLNEQSLFDEIIFYLKKIQTTD
ncbi:hypothetical protein D0T49_10810 [Paludibacter sp. 221]|uniref:DUF6913 domain-containing protein n=1 Tax=Paludibacter sp. 221 TaxID=2302939 RepID=UPI0013CF72CB|nr:hypothetical protein [Paludibacter sp. 221]NDV47537.1 hypothetical protein [Paludibacter sp. 221]